MQRVETDVAIIGGGPAGCTAALCLRALGRSVSLFEKLPFPRYRIGESLLPGTLSLLSRLGVLDVIETAGFQRKPAATFVWGDQRPPFDFSMAAPKTAPWTFDYALQVNRAEFDALLLQAAADRGVDVRHAHQVVAAHWQDDTGPAAVAWQRQPSATPGSGSNPESGTTRAGYLIDASGGQGLVARQLGERAFDPALRNMATWTYIRGGRRFRGGLQGNTLSVAFRRGWIWIIPLKDDIYSVGVVTGVEDNERLRAAGPERFFADCIAESPEASAVLAGGERVDEFKVTRDWSYSSSHYAAGRAFVCGDAACFIDPLFSQGVHLATYAGVLAASAIDHLLDHPDRAAAVKGWYQQQYQDIYRRYHDFVSAFYASYQGDDGGFWAHRRANSIDGSIDGSTGDPGRDQRRRSAERLQDLWRHDGPTLGDQVDTAAQAMRRLAFASEHQRRYQSVTRIRWRGGQPRLYDSFTVHPTRFRLQPCQLLGDESGRVLAATPLGEPHRRLFAELADAPATGPGGAAIGYRELQRRLRKLRPPAPADRIVHRLFEEGLLEGFDGNGQAVEFEPLLRFDGVGGEHDLP